MEEGRASTLGVMDRDQNKKEIDRENGQGLAECLYIPYVVLLLLLYTFAL